MSDPIRRVLAKCPKRSSSRKSSGVKSPMDRRFESATFALVRGLLSKVSCDLSRNVLDCLDRNDHAALLDLPFKYEECQDFRDAYLAYSILSKYPKLDVPIDRAQVALQKFHVSEEECRASNIRLARYLLNIDSPIRASSITERVFHAARRRIKRCLGPFSWDLAEPHFAFGPGATTDLRHRQGDSYYKFKAQPCTTSGNAVISYTCISRVPSWFSSLCDFVGVDPETMKSLPIDEQIRRLFLIVSGNRITTVPKNAKGDRIIAVEPTMNTFVQHGIGALIRRRLKRVGVDLDNQGYNQKLAKDGSLDGSLATLDLSAASDSVSLGICELLLPSDWLIAIKQARSHSGVLPDGSVIRYQKVSSMGNGYTFELESLIFWALCSSVLSELKTIDRRLAVYGDDLIVPVAAVELTIKVLREAGFSLNPEKSFWSGPFRESCGKHFYHGSDVTPIYIRNDIDTPERIIWFANQVRRWARYSVYGLDARCKPVYDQARSMLPVKLRHPVIPDGKGDIALFGDLDECRPHRIHSQQFLGWEGWWGRGFVRIARTRQFSDVPYLLRQLSGKPDFCPVTGLRIARGSRWERVRVLSESSGVAIPQPVDRWRSVRVVCEQWPSYGPWL